MTRTPPIRFYAGVPLVDCDGHVVGALAVFDREPRMVGDARAVFEPIVREGYRLIDMVEPIIAPKSQKIPE